MNSKINIADFEAVGNNAGGGTKAAGRVKKRNPPLRRRGRGSRELAETRLIFFDRVMPRCGSRAAWEIMLLYGYAHNAHSAAKGVGRISAEIVCSGRNIIVCQSFITI